MKLCKEKILEAMETISFKDDLMLRHPDITTPDHYKFITKVETYDNTKFDISTVVGTLHPRYYDQTWLECLLNLKRSSYLDRLRCSGDHSSILYYQADSKDRAKEHWTIDVYDEKAYIVEGNHRTIISKFLAAAGIIQKEQFGITVNYITFNKSAYRAYTKLDNFIKSLPKIIQDEIEINVACEKIEKLNITHYKPTYFLYIGYYKATPVKVSFSSFLEFKKELFLLIRKAYKTHRWYLILEQTIKFFNMK